MRLQALYIEKEVEKEPLTKEISEKYSSLPRISIERFQEVFNRKGQCFRLQKSFPSLILAKKAKGLVLPTPPGYGIGGEHNYYFSHMYNCVFDCRYCFLQGMYSSANYVVFVNVQDFLNEIKATLEKHQADPVYFFSGYDCDSLALEPVTHFMEGVYSFFEKTPLAIMELRTKSTQIDFLLKKTPLENWILAFTLSPDSIAKKWEHKAPSLQKRLEALKKLQDAGWPIALRFDPLIYQETFFSDYEELFEQVFSILDPSSIHSITLGPFRVPKEMFKKMRKLYPKEALFYAHLQERAKLISLDPQLEDKMRKFCLEYLEKKVPSSILFPMSF